MVPILVEPNELVGSTGPCLKWPGGKQWLVPKLVPVLKAELSRVYREPFFGAGAVFFALGPSKAAISDVNPELIDFIKCLEKFPERILRTVWRMSNTAECYYRVRSSNPKSSIGRAGRFLYLNRTCWGGIFRTNRLGEFNVPFGDSGRRICRKEGLLACSRALARVEMKCCDFEESIKRAAEGDVVYADPPYTTRGENNGFVRYNETLFSWNDQVRLAKACREAAGRGAFVAVSGLWHREVLDLYNGWWAWRLPRNSSVSRDPSGRGSVNETVIFSRKPGVSPGCNRKWAGRIGGKGGESLKLPTVVR